MLERANQSMWIRSQGSCCMHSCACSCLQRTFSRQGLRKRRKDPVRSDTCQSMGVNEQML